MRQKENILLVKMSIVVFYLTTKKPQYIQTLQTLKQEAYSLSSSNLFALLAME